MENWYVQTAVTARDVVEKINYIESIGGSIKSIIYNSAICTHEIYYTIKIKYE